MKNGYFEISAETSYESIDALKTEIYTVLNALQKRKIKSSVNVLISPSPTVKLSNLCTSEDAFKLKKTIVKRKNATPIPNIRMEFQRKVHINPTSQKIHSDICFKGSLI